MNRVRMGIVRWHRTVLQLNGLRCPSLSQTGLLRAAGIEQVESCDIKDVQVCQA